MARNPAGTPIMIDKNPRKIRSMFSEIAPTYDTLNHLLSFGVDRLWRTAVARMCARYRSVLDICCGTGDLALTIASSGESDVVGIDFSEEMVRRAIEKSRRLRTDKRTLFCVGDGLRLPFGDGTFDACTVAFGIRNTRDTLQCAREMRRVTRKGGKIFILEFTVPEIPVAKELYLLYSRRLMESVGNVVSGSRAYSYLVESVKQYYSNDEMRAILRSSGLVDVRSRPMTFGVCAITSGTVPGI